MVIKAEIYQQAFQDEPIMVFVDISAGEYQRIDCDDCGGTGCFQPYDIETSWECRVCKGAGTIWFNVY